MAQVTDIDGGISGITALSPAISSAIDAKTLALSAYEDGSYHIYLIDRRSRLPESRCLDGNARLRGGRAAALAARAAPIW